MPPQRPCRLSLLLCRCRWFFLAPHTHIAHRPAAALAALSLARSLALSLACPTPELSVLSAGGGAGAGVCLVCRRLSGCGCWSSALRVALYPGARCRRGPYLHGPSMVFLYVWRVTRVGVAYRGPGGTPGIWPTHRPATAGPTPPPPRPRTRGRRRPTLQHPRCICMCMYCALSVRCKADTSSTSALPFKRI
eukprot:scaffold10478_cov114-Isochrysis_galbana.AAC.3